jgi:hypothetical protein
MQPNRDSTFWNRCQAGATATCSACGRIIGGRCARGFIALHLGTMACNALNDGA